MIDPNAMTFAEIHADLQRYLNDEEIVDPIGYLETIELRLMVAIAASDSAELGLSRSNP